MSSSTNHAQIELAVQGRLRDSVLRRYLRAQDYLEPRRDPEDPHAKSVSLLVNPQVVGNILAQVSERKSLKVLKVLKKTEKARPLEYGLLDLLRDLEKRNKKVSTRIQFLRTWFTKSTERGRNGQEKTRQEGQE